MGAGSKFFDKLEEALAMVNADPAVIWVSTIPWHTYKYAKAYQDRLTELPAWRVWLIDTFGKYIPDAVLNWIWWAGSEGKPEWPE